VETDHLESIFRALRLDGGFLGIMEQQEYTELQGHTLHFPLTA
jgi:hypothetical protein